MPPMVAALFRRSAMPNSNEACETAAKIDSAAYEYWEVTSKAEAAALASWYATPETIPEGEIAAAARAIWEAAAKAESVAHALLESTWETLAAARATLKAETAA